MPPTLILPVLGGFQEPVSPAERRVERDPGPLGRLAQTDTVGKRLRIPEPRVTPLQTRQRRAGQRVERFATRRAFVAGQRVRLRPGCDLLRPAVSATWRGRKIGLDQRDRILDRGLAFDCLHKRFALASRQLAELLNKCLEIFGFHDGPPRGKSAAGNIALLHVRTEPTIANKRRTRSSASIASPYPGAQVTRL